VGEEVDENSALLVCYAVSSFASFNISAYMYSEKYISLTVL
jgi:hypothetical protein